MSIADKLTLIANNMDDVCDAGYKKAMNDFCPPFKDYGGIAQFVPASGSEVTVHWDGDALVVCGKNLYDAKTYPLTDGFYINNKNGDIAGAGTHATYCATLDYIPVEHLRGRYITLNYTPGGTLPGMIFYDLSKTRIENSGGKGNNILVPKDAYYMRFSSNIVDKDKVQIELGSVATDYEAYNAETYHTIVFPERVLIHHCNKVIRTYFATRVVIDDGVASPGVLVTGLEDPITLINNLRNQLTPTSTEG